MLSDLSFRVCPEPTGSDCVVSRVIKICTVSVRRPGETMWLKQVLLFGLVSDYTALVVVIKMECRERWGGLHAVSCYRFISHYFEKIKQVLWCWQSSLFCIDDFWKLTLLLQLVIVWNGFVGEYEENTVTFSVRIPGYLSTQRCGLCHVALICQIQVKSPDS